MPPPQTDAARPDLTGFEVLLCVSGGIAAYKSATVVSRLVQRGCGVTVAMTRSARRFITPLTLRALSARKVHSSLWQAENPSDQQHLTLTEAADLVIVAPATANTIARARMGLADDLVSALLLSASSPILLAPAMNTRMWNNPIVRENVRALSKHGMRIIDPTEGWLACREIGAGRMAEPDDIVAHAAAILAAATPKSASEPKP
jgi:phosphopantothenoylcysteine decarboxylase/phosphopantothenate--cysteine ligase